MKQKSGGIKRLMEFTGKHRGLLTVSRILSGISSAFILGPFLCVYFAARDLMGEQSCSLGPACSGAGADWSAPLFLSIALLPCRSVPHREKPENGGTETSRKNAYGIL